MGFFQHDWKSLTGYFKLQNKHKTTCLLQMLARKLPYHFCLLLYEPRHEKNGYLPMRKQSADQLRNNCEADQRLCFRYSDSKIPSLPRPKISRF